MKRWLWIVALLGVAAGASRGQNPGEWGPGAQGSTLRIPGMDAPNPPTPTLPTSPALPPGYQGAWNAALVPGQAGLVRTGGAIALPPSNSVDLNRDITITRDVGPWTILVMSYTTPRDNPSLDAAKMAREFVSEWNTNPAYAKLKLKAYVFNYGAEEKQKEYERVQKLRQEQIEALNQAGLNGKSMPIRVHTVYIDEHTAVLLGGFAKADAAMDLVNKIRKLPDPDPKRVKLDIRLSAAYEPDKKAQPGRVAYERAQYVNPFTKAMPVRNPAAPKEDTGGMSAAEELDFLRKINSKEPFSLLNTRKPITLAVKQFNSQFKATKDAQDAENFFNQITAPFGKKTERKDYALQNAHNLAEGLRKAGLDGLAGRPEAYVLHCKYCSYVTVGSYDSPQDPALVQCQRYLDDYFSKENFRSLDMFASPTPMLVPGFAAK